MNNTTMTRRWQVAAKRGLCLLLCLLMFATLLPTKAYAAPAKVTQEQAKKRIAQLQSELGDKYFTVNRKACNTSFEKTTAMVAIIVPTVRSLKLAGSKAPSHWCQVLSKTAQRDTFANIRKENTAAQRPLPNPAPALRPLPPGISLPRSPAIKLSTNTLKPPHTTKVY